MINGSIEVRVLEIRGGRVKLGFDYPAGNTVFRQELFAKIQAENQAAAALSGDSFRLQAALINLGNHKIGMDSANNLRKQKDTTNEPIPDQPHRRSTDK